MIKILKRPDGAYELMCNGRWIGSAATLVEAERMAEEAEPGHA
jgi:hypothetical protein